MPVSVDAQRRIRKKVDPLPWVMTELVNHVAGIAHNETARVLGCFVAAIAISFSDLEIILRIGLLAASTFYTVLKIIKTIRNWRDLE